MSHDTEFRIVRPLRFVPREGEVYAQDSTGAEYRVGVYLGHDKAIDGALRLSTMLGRGFDWHDGSAMPIVYSVS